jgi:uncharacterized repeat protein (TIGR04138 family)
VLRLGESLPRSPFLVMDTNVPRSPAAELAPLVKLLAEDPRYKIEAYQFVAAGLEYAQEVLGLGRPDPVRKRRKAPVKRGSGDTEPPVRHVSGQDLCWALKGLAHKQYGLMAKLVLASWGVHSTADFGTIVYNLIGIGKMSKSHDDRREDFDNVYDFEQALVRDYAITKEAVPCHP